MRCSICIISRTRRTTWSAGTALRAWMVNRWRVPTKKTRAKRDVNTPFKTSVAGGIAELVIDHPPVNALDSQGWCALASEIEALGQRTDVRVIVLRAQGRGFCA